MDVKHEASHDVTISKRFCFSELRKRHGSAYDISQVHASAFCKTFVSFLCRGTCILNIIGHHGTGLQRRDMALSNVSTELLISNNLQFYMKGNVVPFIFKGSSD